MAQFDGRPGALPITAYYKGDFALQFSFTSGGSAYSLVGASATFVIYERNGTAALSLSSGAGLTISGAAGTVELDITNAQIVALATQEYNYEMILTLSSGTVWPVLDSVFNVSDSGQSSYSGSTVEVALDGGTVTLTIVPGGGISDGYTLSTGLTFPNTGLHILDTNATHDLILSPGSNLTADRTLTVTTGDADRTLTISGDTTLSGGTHSGTNTGDQTDVTGNSGTVTVADAVGDTTTWVLLGTAQTGNLSPATDAGLTYNATTNALTTTTFVGALTGNADTVTGFSGTSSGTNTGDQNTFSTVAVSGQSNIVANTAADTLTIAAGNNITITTDASTDTVTIAAGSVSADTIWDAKGDLVAGTGANAAQKLTVGTDGHTLYSDSAQTAGLRWGPSIISPTQLTADQDNYTPTGWASAQIVRIDGDSSMRAITSMAAGYSGEVKQVVNVGSYPVYFPGEHPDGTAANRILTGGIDHILLPGDAINIIYDGTSSRWRIPVRRNEVFYPKSIFYQAGAGSATAGDWGEIGLGGTSVSTSVLPRCWTLATSTSSTGASYIGFSKSLTDVATFGDAHMYFQAMLSLDNLSDGTETYEFDFSLTSDNTAFPYPNSSVGIRYTHSVNSGKFQLYSKNSGGTVAVADSGITVSATALYAMRIDIDKSLSEIRAYIDNTFVGRIASGMPGTTGAGARIGINKSAGTTSRVVRVYSLAACFIFP